MQPLNEVTVSRPWHWGIAIVSAPLAAVPEVLDQGRVTASQEALVVKVRHAQDIEAEVFEDDWSWATATVVVRSLTGFDEDAADLVYEGLLLLPDGRLSIGDADGEVIVADLPARSRVRVHAPDGAGSEATFVRIDVSPETG